MKKVVKKIILLILCILVLQVIFNILKNKHEINYTIVNNNEKINVNEKYLKNKYYFNIKYNNTNFKITYDNDFSKSKKVISKIETYSNNDLICIYPVMKNEKYLNIICSKDSKQYYYSYLTDKLEEFVKLLQEKGYQNSAWTNDSRTKSLGKSTIYIDNIPDKSYIYVWKYNGFYTLNKSSQQQLNIFSSDTYVNSLGIRVNNYYVIPDYDEQYTYDHLLIYNMTNNKQKILKLKNKITNDYYNNGVVDNKLYIFDFDNLIQYKINPRNNKVEKIGDKKIGGLYYNTSWSTKNIYEFKNEKIVFNDFKTPPELSDYQEIFALTNDYYYLDNDYNMIYYNSIMKSKTYLFNIKNIKSIKLIENDLYFINEDSLYVFNMQTGIKRIMIYSELSFNPNNRYEVYKK